jgi:hypothetical protein
MNYSKSNRYRIPRKLKKYIKSGLINMYRKTSHVTIYCYLTQEYYDSEAIHGHNRKYSFTFDNHQSNGIRRKVFIK